MSDDFLFVTTKINAVSSLDGGIKRSMGGNKIWEQKVVVGVIHIRQRGIGMGCSSVEDRLCARLDATALLICCIGPNKIVVCDGI